MHVYKGFRVHTEYNMGIALAMGVQKDTTVHASGHKVQTPCKLLCFPASGGIVLNNFYLWKV